ncbi:unnamed protein product, partial [Staurois parvus]
ILLFKRGVFIFAKHCINIYTILPKVLGHPSKSLDSGVPIASMVTGMQTASTNICERMGHSQELSKFKRGTVIGCHLCNKSIREIFLLLNIPRTTVSGIITKWKKLGNTETQPQSGRPRKMTEWGQCMLKCAKDTNCLQSQKLKTSKLHVVFRLAQQRVESFMEWVSMSKQLHPSLTSPSAMQSVECSGVKHATTGL